jgi:ssDNA-binding Zn-finger/Zn-ribbon topoisomerase 1
MPIECPECGSPMRLRRSDYGPFFGCSEYPECTQIVRIREEFRNLSDEELREADESMVED